VSRERPLQPARRRLLLRQQQLQLLAPLPVLTLASQLRLACLLRVRSQRVQQAQLSPPRPAPEPLQPVLLLALSLSQAQLAQAQLAQAQLAQAQLAQAQLTKPQLEPALQLMLARQALLVPVFPVTELDGSVRR
jgi:uncharacterized protein YjbI with pentapeptide repeats